MSYRYYDYHFKPYVPVAERRARAEGAIKKLQDKQTLFPVQLSTRTISRTFWGKAWCQHIESFSDYRNRLPRGRTYVRHGLVCHLLIAAGTVEAMVYGSSMYRVRLDIKPLPQKKWDGLKQRCLGKIGSVLELLSGKLSIDVMEMVCNRDKGLFPASKEIHLACDCPDWARMCKHVAAVLYGVAVRLDESPEQLFLLRGVDYQELIDPAALIAETTQPARADQRRLDTAHLGDIFGITLAGDVGNESMPDVSLTGKDVKKKKASGRLSSDVPVKKSVKVRRKKTVTAEKLKNVMNSGFPERLTGSSIYKKRRELQCSQRQFAQMLGVSASTVCHWESLKRRRLTVQETTKAKLAAFWSVERR